MSQPRHISEILAPVMERLTERLGDRVAPESAIPAAYSPTPTNKRDLPNKERER